MRDDDLAFVDSMFSFDLPRMMESVTEAVQTYSELCERRFTAPGNVEPEALVEPPTPESEEDRSFDVNEVLFSLMSEKDKLAELARLLGRLRFAVEGWDASTVDEVSQEITTLGPPPARGISGAKSVGGCQGLLPARFDAGPVILGQVFPSLRWRRFHRPKLGRPNPIARVRGLNPRDSRIGLVRSRPRDSVPCW